MSFWGVIKRITAHRPGLRVDTTHFPDRGPKTCPNCIRLYAEIDRLKGEGNKITAKEP